MGRFKFDINATLRNLEEGKRIVDALAAEEARLSPQEREQDREREEFYDLCDAWYPDTFPFQMLGYPLEQVWQARVALENFLMQCVANGGDQ